MPLEFIPIDEEIRILMPGDRGFFIKCKPRWHKQLRFRAKKFLEAFNQRYFEARCPEEAAALKAKEPEQTVPIVSEEKEEESEEAKKDTEETEDTASKDEAASEMPAAEDKTGIRFVPRDVIFDEGHGFIATNLADPADFLHFAFHTVASSNKQERRPKFPMRIMPVQTVCEARPKTLEAAVVPLVEKIFEEDAGKLYRFSITHKKTMHGQWLSQGEARSVVRNAIWSVNPASEQCIKHQDFAVVLEMMEPLLCVGLAKEFFRLGSYHTSNANMGLKELHSDSEDDISDDPDLDIEANQRRVLRIKRKRRAEAKAGKDGDKKRNWSGNMDSGEEDDAEEDYGGDDGQEQEGNDDCED